MEVAKPVKSPYPVRPQVASPGLERVYLFMALMGILLAFNLAATVMILVGGRNGAQEDAAGPAPVTTNTEILGRIANLEQELRQARTTVDAQRMTIQKMQSVSESLQAKVARVPQMAEVPNGYFQSGVPLPPDSHPK